MGVLVQAMLEQLNLSYLQPSVSGQAMGGCESTKWIGIGIEGKKNPMPLIWLISPQEINRRLNFSDCETHHFPLIRPYYCWWLKSCTTWDVWNPINNGKNYLSTGAGFQPSTVGPEHFNWEVVLLGGGPLRFREIGGQDISTDAYISMLASRHNSYLDVPGS